MLRPQVTQKRDPLGVPSPAQRYDYSQSLYPNPPQIRLQHPKQELVFLYLLILKKKKNLILGVHWVK